MPKKGRGLLRVRPRVTAEARNAAIAAAHREARRSGRPDRAIRQSIKAERAGELAPTETTLELVKTMQAQNARLEAVEARRGLFGALWPRKAA